MNFGFYGYLIWVSGLLVKVGLGVVIVGWFWLFLWLFFWLWDCFLVVLWYGEIKRLLNFLFEDDVLVFCNFVWLLFFYFGIWKWGLYMLVLILYCVIGSGMVIVGVILLVWWLVVIVGGVEFYVMFFGVFMMDMGVLNVVGYIVGIGLMLLLF